MPKRVWLFVSSGSWGTVQDGTWSSAFREASASLNSSCGLCCRTESALLVWTEGALFTIL